MISAGDEEVLRLHPDLAGHLADEGKLTRDSSKEQQSAGLACFIFIRMQIFKKHCVSL